MSYCDFQYHKHDTSQGKVRILMYVSFYYFYSFFSSMLVKVLFWSTESMLDVEWVLITGLKSPTEWNKSSLW